MEWTLRSLFGGRLVAPLFDSEGRENHLVRQWMWGLKRLPVFGLPLQAVGNHDQSSGGIAQAKMPARHFNILMSFTFGGLHTGWPRHYAIFLRIQGGSWHITVLFVVPIAGFGEYLHNSFPFPRDKQNSPVPE